MALMQISVIPLGTGSTSASSFVADFQKTLAESKLSFTLTDMSTIVEGETSKLLAIAAKIQSVRFLSRKLNFLLDTIFRIEFERKHKIVR